MTEFNYISSNTSKHFFVIYRISNGGREYFCGFASLHKTETIANTYNVGDESGIEFWRSFIYECQKFDSFTEAREWLRQLKCKDNCFISLYGENDKDKEWYELKDFDVFSDV